MLKAEIEDEDEYTSLMVPDVGGHDDNGVPAVKAAKETLWNNEFEESLTSRLLDDNVYLRFIYLSVNADSALKTMFKGTQNLLHTKSFKDEAQTRSLRSKTNMVVKYLPHIQFYYAEVDIVYCRKKSLADLLLELL